MTIKYLYWNDDTGYGIAAKKMMEALIKSGANIIQVSLIHTATTHGEYATHSSRPDTSMYDIVFIHSAPYYIEYLIEPGKFNIAYCTWETTALPLNYVKVLNQCDAVFVPSGFNRECFIRSGVFKPILKLPHISEFKGNGKTQKDHGVFIFYSIGMWTNRKNNFELLDAFAKAFKGEKSIRLILKTSELDYTKPASSFLRKFRMSRFNKLSSNKKLNQLLKENQNISVMKQELSGNEIKKLHLDGDCYISFCRSEGWGLGAYEAAWYGKPILITGFGGQLDYLNDQDSYLLPYTLHQIQESVWTEYNGHEQSWAHVNIDKAIETMKYIVDHKSDALKRGQLLQAKMIKEFCDTVVIQNLLSDIQTILQNKFF